jgi:hypothetical protein
MLNRMAVKLVAGAAIFALGASVASAQDTTRTRPTSTKRIPVAKESHGEVAATVRVDTVTVYRTDTLQSPPRIDTVRTTNTVTKYDTVTQMIPMQLHNIGGFYWGIGVGSSMPAANFIDSDHPGWRGEVPFGIDPVGSPLGLRFNAGYGRYSPHDWVSGLINNAQMFTGEADLKLRIMSGTPAGLHIQLYGIGGGSYNRYKDILENNHGIYSVGDQNGTPSLPSNPDHNWQSGFGYNAGAGVNIGHGITNFFVESRYERFSGKNSMISHVPIVVGMSWY